MCGLVQVIFRDFKSSNILLDENMIAKFSTLNSKMVYHILFGRFYAFVVESWISLAIILEFNSKMV